MATIIEEECEINNTSLLNARLQSILAQNYPHSVIEDLDENKASAPTKVSDSVPIYLRIKNSPNFEQLYQINDDTTLVCKIPKVSKSNRNNHANNVVSKMFNFSRIFGPNTTQSDIFKNVVQNKMVDFMNGINSTLLTYGASGSGKTFTIVGDSAQPGIIPRSLEFLFGALPTLSLCPSIKPTHSGGIYRLSNSESNNENSIKHSLLNELQDVNHHRQVYRTMQVELQDEVIPTIDEDISDVNLSVWISFAEIYNEYVYDLLVKPGSLKHSQPRKKLRLVYYNNHAYIKDLKFINVSSASEAYCVLQYGLQNLNYAATSINDHSSRSHSIFTIRLAQASDTTEGISVSAFNFCDLAGSERIKKTNNAGHRLKESNNINTSLMVLGRCITAIRDGQKSNNTRIIPFRDSKFTQLLQNALSGNEAICMIVNINPIIEMFDESQHVLNFSAIAKEVSIEQQQLIERPKKKICTQKDNPKVEELKMHLAYLRDQIEQERIDNEEEEESMIQNYKDIVSNADHVWQNTFQTIQTRIIEHKRRSYNLADRNINEPATKRQKMSVVIIDSSSDEEEDNSDEEKSNKTSSTLLTSRNINEPTTKRQKMSVVIIDSSSDEEENSDEEKSNKTSSTLLTRLQNELQCIKNEFEANQVILQNILTKNNKNSKLIEEGNIFYNDMKSHYEEEIKKLNEDILKQNEKITKLNNYLECCTTEKVESSDVSSDV